MSTFFTVLSPMVSLFLLILAGVVTTKLGYLDDYAVNKISALLVHIINPFLLLVSAFNATGVTHSSMLLVLAISFLVFLLFGVIGTLTAPLFDPEASQQGMYKLMFMFSNLGFIGIPVVSAVLGADYLVYVAEFNLMYNLFFYTYGVSLLSGGFSRSSLKQVINAGTVSAILALVIVWFDLSVPDFLMTAFTYLGDCNTPLALLLVGAALSKTRLRDIFSSRRLYIFSAVKLLALPLLSVPVFRLLGLDSGLIATCALMIGMPVGNMPLILGTERGIDCTTCSSGIIMSTLLCVITIPFLMLFV